MDDCLTILQPEFQNGLPATAPDMSTPPYNMHKITSGASDQSHSPISRTETPNMHHDPNIAPQHIFDGVGLNDHAFGHSPSLPNLHLSHPSPGSTSSLADRHLEPPQTYEQLQAANTQLKSRLSELEAINTMQRASENRVRSENDELKRCVEMLEQSLNNMEENQPPSKRARVSDVNGELTG